MNAPNDPRPGSTPAASVDSTAQSTSMPRDWHEALLALISSRAALIEIEIKQIIQAAVLRLLRVATAMIGICFTWALLLAGSIAAIAHFSGISWHWLALIAAALHLLAVIALVRAASRPAPPAFQATRSEFQKDRTWIENLFKTRKSND